MSEQMREETFQDNLFQLTMKKKWKQVVEIYKQHPTTHKTMLTRSEETAFHIAISNYHSRIPSHAIYVEQMIDIMEKNGSLIAVLSMQNVRGDTPLHLAAAVGCAAICERIAEKNRELISIRNERGETPLFVAANHGKLQAFLCLHELYNDKKDEPDESLCRREDGNTILHTAIFGEYFTLAYQIIAYYPKLVNSLNAEGDFPLHVLARKPNVFKSSRHLGFYDSIIYYCVFAAKLKQQRYNRRASQNGWNHRTRMKYPENYATCVNIFFLLCDPIYKSFKAGFRSCNKPSSRPTDEENQQHKRKEHEIKEAKGESKHDGFFPPNYTTCILLFKFATKVILTVLGVGFGRIKKIQEKKERHTHTMQIMSKMIESEPRYRYDSHGQRPLQKLEYHLEGIEIPDKPPHVDEHDAHLTIQTDIGATSSSKDQHSHENGKNQNKLVGKAANGLVKETPLLVAAKMGIPEMVKKIVSTYPVAVEDQDSDGKNALMLAAENRHTSVFDYLRNTDLPEYVFHQVDNEGDSILHQAAKLGETQPWHIPGAALQMQWEIKWYEHVKRSIPPLFFAHHNANGETPRKIFTRTHEDLVKAGNEWLIKTSESCSFIAALIAAVAFATAATVPGGLNQNTGRPILQDHQAFDIFSITSLFALCLSVTALVFFLAIITSRFEEHDFRTSLPRKLLMGLTCLFSAIAAMLLSFCAGHTFILREKLRFAAVPIYAVATIPVTFFAMAQLPLYFDLLWAAFIRVPLRSYKLFHE